MVSLEDDLVSRQLVQETKIRQRLRKIHAPGNIAGDHDRIIRGNNAQPVFCQPLFIILPAVEYIHRLVRSEGKMRVGNRKQRHIFHFLSELQHCT